LSDNTPDQHRGNDISEKHQPDWRSRTAATLDAARPDAVASRKAKGFRTARENLDDLCDPGSFIEYGQLAIAAQRQRRTLHDLRENTAADGILTGVATINADLFSASGCRSAIIISDFTVLAGTQGYFHHKKLDRILKLATEQTLPVIMYTEGGGGRPGDVDVTTEVSGLTVPSFGLWAALSGVVPRIAVNNGYCFAGNAALFGCADITIATRSSWIGMAGPAMIEGGGLGTFQPRDIGPMEVQTSNGVVDLIVDDEAAATSAARKLLGYFQGYVDNWDAPDQEPLASALPDNRRFSYKIRNIINTIADTDSFTELRPHYGSGIISGFLRIEGRPMGVIANDCRVQAGAIGAAAAEKAARFLQLCDAFDIPLLSLCDTPGFMVGPDSEQDAAVRRMSRLFVVGANVRVPWICVVIRKAYGLGAMAMSGGSLSRPDYTVAWPQGEFGAMGLEGAVELGFKKELAAEKDDASRQKLFDHLLEKQYAQGSAIEAASFVEIDAVIDPRQTRRTIVAALPPKSSGHRRKKHRYVDVW